jgi:enolase-phosphatase E1
MFPFVLEHLDNFLRLHAHRPDVLAACEQIAKDAGHPSLAAWRESCNETCSQQALPVDLIATEVRQLMARDVKATGLKTLQGLIWEQGFTSGQLVAHIYPDVIPAIERWRGGGIDVRIYSSGSIAAQKLFFGHVQEAGNCLALFSGHYDTTVGGKKSSESYQRIAADWGIAAQHLLFVSDIFDELSAAQSAGYQVVASLRPGNAPMPGPAPLPFPTIDSFSQIEFCE